MSWKIIRLTICWYLVPISVLNISWMAPTNSSGIALEDKWLTLPDISHIIATCYNRVVVRLVLPERGICETYFPIRCAPPLNPHSNILCLGLIPDHFLHVFFLKKVFHYHRLVGNGRITRLVRRSNGSFLLWIDKPCSKTSCLRSRSRRKNQQMNSIWLFVTLPLRKNQNNNSKSCKKRKFMHYH